MTLEVWRKFNVEPYELKDGSMCNVSSETVLYFEADRKTIESLIYQNIEWLIVENMFTVIVDNEMVPYLEMSEVF